MFALPSVPSVRVPDADWDFLWQQAHSEWYNFTFAAGTSEVEKLKFPTHQQLGTESIKLNVGARLARSPPS